MPGTTPIYGFPYPDPSDLVANYPALGQQLAEDVEDQIILSGGLVPVTPTSVAGTGVTLTGGLVTFTGSAAVSVNGVFTSAYRNYSVVFGNIVLASGDVNLNWRLRAAGTDASGSDYRFGRYVIGAGASSAAGSSNNVVDNRFYIGAANSTYNMGSEVIVVGPQRSEKTVINAHVTSSVLQLGGCIHNLTNAYDGFTIYPDSSTIAGSVRVYGFRS